MISNKGIERIIALMVSDFGHIGIGTGLAPTATSESLENEQTRKPVSALVDGETVIFDAYWDETEANGVNYTNVGLFGDADTSTVGTGKLICGNELNVSKDATQSLTISVEITVREGN